MVLLISTSMLQNKEDPTIWSKLTRDKLENFFLQKQSIFENNTLRKKLLTIQLYKLILKKQISFKTLYSKPVLLRNRLLVSLENHSKWSKLIRFYFPLKTSESLGLKIKKTLKLIQFPKTSGKTWRRCLIAWFLYYFNVWHQNLLRGFQILLFFQFYYFGVKIKLRFENIKSKLS